MNGSIKRQSTFFLAVLLLVTVVTLSLSVLQGIKKNQKIQYERYLYHQMRTVNQFVYQNYTMESETGEYYFEKERLEEFFEKHGKDLARQMGVMSGMRVILYNKNGEELGDSFPVDMNPQLDMTRTLQFALQNQTAYQIEGEVLYYFSPVSCLEGQIGVVQFQYSLAENNAFYRNILWLFVIIGSIVFIVSFLISYFYFNGITDSILKLKQAVKQIESGKYDKLPSIKRKDELQELSQGIQHMSMQIQTHICNMEEEKIKLQRLVEKLKMLEKQQREFIGNITHEFKTPLTIIRAYIDLINTYPEDQHLSEEGKNHIQKQAQRLLEMVEKTLQLAALEKYEFESQCEHIELSSLLHEICDSIEGKAKKFNITIYRNLVEAEVEADRTQMIQIFINLLDNAIKYNEPYGEIFISNVIIDNRVIVYVKDTGIGISKQDRARIFEPFYRVDKGRSRQTGGTGLGLALVKQLVEKQHGEIKVLDIEGKGTTICVSFPLKC